MDDAAHAAWHEIWAPRCPIGNPEIIHLDSPAALRRRLEEILAHNDELKL
jgi:hypothetical protein